MRGTSTVGDTAGRGTPGRATMRALPGHRLGLILAVHAATYLDDLARIP